MEKKAEKNKSKKREHKDVNTNHDQIASEDINPAPRNNMR